MNATLVSPTQADYDSIAGFYRRHWCGHYHAGLTAMLERLLFADLPAGAHVLDLCCGTGAVAGYLVGRGLAVTGIDASEEMLRFARQEVPEGEFLVANAEAFRLPAVFAACVCTFDSLSYFLDEDALGNVFSNVYAALRPDGRFIFDLSLEAAYKSEWQQSCSIVETDEACFVRGSYDETERLGRTLITTFHRNGSWQRTDVEFLARCHDPEEVLRVLTRAGFVNCACHNSDHDEELRSELGPRRVCFLATRP